MIPYISVKKEDGKVVQMTLDEFEVYKKQKKDQSEQDKPVENNNIDQQKQETPDVILDLEKNEDDLEPEFRVDSKSSQPHPLSTVALAEAEPHELATTTPVTDIFIDEARAKSAWTPEDHRSPLEEDMGEIDNFKNQGHVHTTAQVKLDNTASIASQISKELMPRFNALVLSYKKGVRSGAQFIEYALRDTTHGGLGFLHEQEARMLLAEVQQKTKVIHKSISQSQVRNAPSLHTRRPLPESAPSIDIDLALPTYTPKQTEHTAIPSPSVVHDMVQPMTQQTTGPEDEIANFSLRDFRRLSKDPRVASEMLYEKFDGWKKDSFILYMKTLTAWKAGPLYTQYIALTLRALTEHTQMKTILDREQQGDGMNMQEYVELVALHGRLVV